MITIYVPSDSAAISVGADAVASALVEEARRRGFSVRLVRNGSRGMFWLEPLIEVALPGGRVAYGPVSPADVPTLFDAGFLTGGSHPLSLGVTEELPWLKRQERLTFARCGITDPLRLNDYRAHGGFNGLTKALALSGMEIVREVNESGAAAPGFRPASNGRPFTRLMPTRSMCAAMPMKVIAAPSPIAW
jgi:formate dehydrogenase iron-sulfur subunit